MTMDATFFQQHDLLTAESAALNGVDVALNEARQALERETGAIQDVARKLATSHESIAHHERKIKQCKSGWRSHAVLQPDTWLSGGVPARVERQYAKLKAKECERAELLETQLALQKRCRSSSERVQTLQSAEKRKRECDDATDAMYTHVVDALATPALATLRAQREQWRNAVDFEQTNAAALERVAKLCHKARTAYTQAAQALASAGRTNQQAQLTNTFDLFTPGPGFGLEAFETISQVQRDELMRAARHQAEVGGRCLHEALSSIPLAAIQRYPQQCAGLGEVHLPRVELTGGGELLLEVFGGDLGDMVANSSAAGKIDRSLAAIDECLHIVAHQQGLVHALLQALRADGTRATSGLRQSNAEVARESERIWVEARAAAVGGGGVKGAPYGAAAPPIAVAVAVSQPPIVVTGLPVATAA